MIFKRRNEEIYFIIINTALSQEPPPDSDFDSGSVPASGFYTLCQEDFTLPESRAPFPSQEAAYDECKVSCKDGNNPCAVPIDSGLLILIIAGASLGIYFTSKNNKKRQFEIQFKLSFFIVYDCLL